MKFIWSLNQSTHCTLVILSGCSHPSGKGTPSSKESKDPQLHLLTYCRYTQSTNRSVESGHTHIDFPSHITIIVLILLWHSTLYEVGGLIKMLPCCYNKFPWDVLQKTLLVNDNATSNYWASTHNPLITQPLIFKIFLKYVSFYGGRLPLIYDRPEIKVDAQFDTLSYSVLRKVRSVEAEERLWNANRSTPEVARGNMHEGNCDSCKVRPFVFFISM